LRKTHRFGETLAGILEEDVYIEGLEGNKMIETDICVKHVIRDGEKKEDDRRNSAEADCIVSLLQKIGNSDTVGVITPYTKQRDLIKKKIKDKRLDFDMDNVITVHGSQGREWDTVILSVSDPGGKGKWFTSSLIPKSKGKQVMNTAVSRVKKRLILVCDYDYWRNNPNEFLGKLVRSGRLMKDSD